MKKKVEELTRTVESKIAATFVLVTDDELAVVLRPGYFSSHWPDRQIRKADRIEVTASYSDAEMEVATLLVTAGGKDVTVKQLTGGILL